MVGEVRVFHITVLGGNASLAKWLKVA